MLSELTKKEIDDRFAERATKYSTQVEDGWNFHIPISNKVSLDTMLNVLCSFGREMTDLKIETKKPVWVKVDGDFKVWDKEAVVAPETMEIIVASLLAHSSSNEEIENYKNGKTDFDLSFRHFGTGEKDEMITGRFRVSICKYYYGWSIVLRFINETLPTKEELAIPQVILDVLKRGNGLILMTGPPGSGKSTTLAVLVQHILDTYPRNILSLEDPVEHIFTDNVGTITQREV